MSYAASYRLPGMRLLGRFPRGTYELAPASKLSGMETGDQLRGALHGQARGVSRGVEDRQDLGDLEREHLPVRWETVEVSLKDAFRIRRIYRKLARKRGSGSLRRITVFVRYENVLRLLEFLGYCLEYSLETLEASQKTSLWGCEMESCPRAPPHRLARRPLEEE